MGIISLKVATRLFLILALAQFCANRLCADSGIETITKNDVFNADKGLFATNVLTISPEEESPDKTLTFGLVGKGSLYPFFSQVHLGCKQAQTELHGVRCLIRSPKFADQAEQDRVISELIDEGVDGIAVSVLSSKHLIERSLKKAQEKNIPVVTFDSDIDVGDLKKNPTVRAAYIGTNNEEMGRHFGRILKQRFPRGGVVCLLSGRQDTPNIMERMKGVRAEISGDQKTRSPGRRLKGINGWTEHPRCPMYSYEDSDIALHQLSFMLSKEFAEIDSFVSLGGWSQRYTSDYMRDISKHKDNIEKFGIQLLFADTLHFQLELLRDGFASMNIGQNPFEMGRQSIHTLYKIKNRLAYEDMVYTPITTCTPETVDHCTATSLATKNKRK